MPATGVRKKAQALELVEAFVERHSKKAQKGVPRRPVKAGRELDV